MNYLAIFEYICRFNTDCLIMTKRKEILDNSFIDKGKEMIKSNKLPIKFYNLINGDSDWEIFERKSKYNRIFIINTDKFIMSPKFSNYQSYSYGKIKIAMLDECHWSGADKLSDFLLWLKSNIVDKLVGFSATPIRPNEESQANSRKIFSNNNELNIIYTRSYLDAIKEGNRVQTKWLIIPTNNSELIELDSGDKKDRVLNSKGFESFIKWLNNFITQSLNKKGILWFANKKNLKKFNQFININKHKYSYIKNISFIPSYSKSHETDADTTENLELFKKSKCNCILLAVFRATEGFDDPTIDFGFNLYTTETSNPLLDQQKEGRVSRNFYGKTIGYFGFLCNQSMETYEMVLVKRLGDWINYLKEFDLEYSNKNKKGDRKLSSTEEYIELLLDPVNIKTINFESIKDKIFNYCESFTGSVGDIRRVLQKENKRCLGLNIELIDTKEKYDEYAKTKTGWSQSDSIQLDSQNWVELLRPDFSEWKNQFYTWDQLKKVCNKNKVKTIQLFKKLSNKDPKVPPYEYILSGLYNTVNNYKDINIILYVDTPYELL